MEWMGVNDIRESFLSYFESKGHKRLPSFPLLPKDDKSLLLINSGMAPMKKWFLGQEEPPCHRVTTCQKCIRTPDIDNVGKDDRHGTYFEMLGNFSFGNYFKKEVIPWAWEYFTEVIKLPKEKLYVTVYQDDDEAYDIWHNVIGLSEDRIFRFGKEDNFWEIGSGPCGPCSEIYFDRGVDTAADTPTAPLAATATVSSKSGTLFSPSLTPTAKATMKEWNTRTSTPVWVLKDLLA